MFFFFYDNPYVAIIGDIKQSKKIEDRNGIQIKLKNVLEEINKKFESDISSNFIITLGDEFQGLLCSGKNTMHIVSEIERKMYPVRIRFGIGVGEIKTDIDKEMALGADGSAYYKAREAVEYLKNNENRKQSVTADVRIEVESESQGTTIMLNTILSLMTAIKDSWSDRQREIIWNMLEFQDSQSEVANRLNIKQPAVQKSFSLGKYYEYKDALDSIGKVLEDIGGRNV